MDIDWNVVLQASIVIVGIFSSMKGTVPVVNWVKNWLKLSGTWAILLTAVVAVIFSVTTLIVSGEITSSSLLVEHLVDTFILILTLGQIEYRKIRDQLG